MALGFCDCLSHTDLATCNAGSWIDPVERCSSGPSTTVCDGELVADVATGDDGDRVVVAGEDANNARRPRLALAFNFDAVDGSDDADDVFDAEPDRDDDDEEEPDSCSAFGMRALNDGDEVDDAMAVSLEKLRVLRVIVIDVPLHDRCAALSELIQNHISFSLDANKLYTRTLVEM
jgi:hypothetical protein